MSSTLSLSLCIYIYTHTHFTLYKWIFYIIASHIFFIKIGRGMLDYKQYCIYIYEGK